jgi:nitrogen regulatory protein P-II 1
LSLLCVNLRGDFSLRENRRGEMRYRKVTGIIRTERLESVERRLQKIHVGGVTVTRCKGYGEYEAFVERQLLATHVRIEVFCVSERADAIAKAIMDEAHTGFMGDGIVAILPVEEIYRVRNKDKIAQTEL